MATNQSAKSSNVPVQITSQIVTKDINFDVKPKIPPLNYKNCRKLEPIMFNFTNYFVNSFSPIQKRT